MTATVYRSAAELFSLGSWKSKGRAVRYRRFAIAAEAIRFAIEELGREHLAGIYLKSTRNDSTAPEYVACTTAATILFPGVLRVRCREHAHDRKTLTFEHPFRLKGIDRTLPAGTYQVITDEELIEGLSFLAYRSLSTMMVVPGKQASSIEMVTIDPLELRAAQDRDAAISQGL